MYRNSIKKKNGNLDGVKPRGGKKRECQVNDKRELKKLEFGTRYHQRKRLETTVNKPIKK